MASKFDNFVSKTFKYVPRIAEVQVYFSLHRNVAVKFAEAQQKHRTASSPILPRYTDRSWKKAPCWSTTFVFFSVMAWRDVRVTTKVSVVFSPQTFATEWLKSQITFVTIVNAAREMLVAATNIATKFFIIRVASTKDVCRNLSLAKCEYSARSTQREFSIRISIGRYINSFRHSMLPMSANCVLNNLILNFWVGIILNSCTLPAAITDSCIVRAWHVQHTRLATISNVPTTSVAIIRKRLSSNFSV